MADEDEKAKELIKNTVLEPDGSVKQMNDDEKAEFRVNLKNIFKVNKNKVDSVYNKTISKMKNNKK